MYYDELLYKLDSVDISFHIPHSTLHIYTMQKYTFFPKESRTLLVFLCKKGIIIIKTYKQLG